MTGAGIWRTITDIITDHTASAVHGTGADIIPHIGATGDTVHGDSLPGDMTHSTIRGTIAAGTVHGMEDGTTLGTAAGMIHGTTEDSTTHGTAVIMAHGTIRIHTIMDGTTRTITTRDTARAVRQSNQVATKTDIMV